MRALVLVLLAGCFEPSPKRGQACDDWCPPPEQCIANTCALIDEETRANYMFVTADKRPIVNQRPEKLDAWCNERAVMGKLPGNYVAWFSTKVTAKSLFETLPAQGWIRPDGLPFANTAEDILAGTLYYPPRVTEAGNFVGDDAVIATGSASDGTALDTCNQLDPGMSGSFVTVGRADAGLQTWTFLTTEMCGIDAHIYCFGKDRTVNVAKPMIPPGGKRAFVTKNVYTLKDPATADQLCRNEANDAPNYVALLATAAQSVSDRFKSSQGPWYRPDGVIVTHDMTQLMAPIELTFDGTHTRGEVWFGASSLTAVATGASSCANWTALAGAVPVGLSERSAGETPFAGKPNGDCGAQYRFYCAEL